jgi:hypothetical protein
MNVDPHIHVAMVFRTPFTATRGRVLPYDTHAAFDASILLSLRVCRVPSLGVAARVKLLFLVEIVEYVSDWLAGRPSWSLAFACTRFGRVYSAEGVLRRRAWLRKTGGSKMGRHIGQARVLAPKARDWWLHGAWQSQRHGTADNGLNHRETPTLLRTTFAASDTEEHGEFVDSLDEQFSILRGTYIIEISRLIEC